MPRGGRRAGRSGKAYAQRTDLAKPAAKLAIVTPHSNVYGQAEKLRRAQQAVPMGGAPAPTPMQASQPSATPPAAQPSLGPGDLGPLTAPTQRPDEPLTAGMPTGDGPGPEVLTHYQAAGRPYSVSDTIAGLAQGDASGELAALLQFAQSKGL